MNVCKEPPNTKEKLAQVCKIHIKLIVIIIGCASAGSSIKQPRIPQSMQQKLQQQELANYMMRKQRLPI
jgi:hypothetical protein